MSDAYDPQGPDDGPPSSSNAYINRKDVKYISIILLVLAIVLFPVYKLMKEKANEHVCVQNLKQISESLTLYEAANDGRYPPLFATGGEGGPALDDQSRAFSWVTLLQTGMNSRASFVCPTSSKGERTQSQHPSDSKETIESSYGFYGTYGLPAPWGDMEASEVPSPDNIVLVAETSNDANVANPTPYKGGKPQDGLVIGYDDSNNGITKESKYVTRLAFPDTADGKFDGKLVSRHTIGINMITASGRLLKGRPADAKLDLTSPGKPTGLWTIPIGVGNAGR